MTLSVVETSANKCTACQLRGAALCRSVAAAAVRGTHAARSRRFSRDATVFEEGRAPGLLGVVRSGILRKVRVSRSGHRTLLGLAFPGDVVGGQEPVEYALQAATEAEICAFDIETVSRMMAEDRGFRLCILRDAARQHDGQLEMVWLRGALTSRERIIAFLAMAADAMAAEHLPDGSVIISVELSRKDWADLANTTVESVSRTLTQLSESRLVETLAPGRYRIRDLARLSRMAGMDPDQDLGAAHNPWAAGTAA